MEKKDIQQTVADILTQHLVQNKMRRTPERYTILHTIYEQTAPFTVEQIYQLLDDRYHVSHVTIYNAISLFISLGLVLPSPSTGDEYFETCYGSRDIFRQICVRCGRVNDFRSTITSNALTATHYSRFRPQNFIVSAYGICSHCQAQLTRQYKKYEREQRQKAVARKTQTPAKHE